MTGALIGFGSEEDWFEYRLEHVPRLQNEFDIRTAKCVSGKEFDKIEPVQIRVA